MTRSLVHHLTGHYQPGRPHPGPGCDLWDTVNETAWKSVEQIYQDCIYKVRSSCEHIEGSTQLGYFLSSVAYVPVSLNFGRDAIRFTNLWRKQRARLVPKAPVAGDSRSLADGRLEQVRLLGEELKSAIQTQDVATVRRLVRCGFASAARFKGRYPLTQALAQGQFGMAKLLVNAGAIPKGSALLSVAVHRHAPDSIVKKILAAGAVPEANVFRYAIDSDQGDVARALRDASHEPQRLLDMCATQTLLRRAIVEGVSDDVVELLIEMGVPVNAQQDGQTTPLHAAVERRRPDTVSLLLSHGASSETRNLLGKKPIDLARNDTALFPLA